MSQITKGDQQQLLASYPGAATTATQHTCTLHTLLELFVRPYAFQF